MMGRKPGAPSGLRGCSRPPHVRCSVSPSESPPPAPTASPGGRAVVRCSWVACAVPLELVARKEPLPSPASPCPVRSGHRQSRGRAAELPVDASTLFNPSRALAPSLGTSGLQGSGGPTAWRTQPGYAALLTVPEALCSAPLTPPHPLEASVHLLLCPSSLSLRLPSQAGCSQRRWSTSCPRTVRSAPSLLMAAHDAKGENWLPGCWAECVQSALPHPLGWGLRGMGTPFFGPRSSFVSHLQARW